MPAIETTPELVRNVYATLEKNLATVRRRLSRPLTYAEKVLFGHLADPERQRLEAGAAYLELRTLFPYTTLFRSRKSVV